jgi:hypothetical protein
VGHSATDDSNLTSFVFSANSFVRSVRSSQHHRTELALAHASQHHVASARLDHRAFPNVPLNVGVAAAYLRTIRHTRDARYASQCNRMPRCARNETCPIVANRSLPARVFGYGTYAVDREILGVGGTDLVTHSPDSIQRCPRVTWPESSGSIDSLCWVTWRDLKSFLMEPSIRRGDGTNGPYRAHR